MNTKTYEKVSVLNAKGTVGCDPEFFIEKEGEVVGAEKAIPDTGLNVNNNDGFGRTSNIIVDGVAVELNPSAQACRANLGNSIRVCFQKLKEQLEEKGYKVHQKGAVTIDKKRYEEISDKNKVLGCGPSNNIHDSKAKVEVTKQNERKRFAGGHIHLSIPKPRPEVMLPLLDLFVGNTCVLIDRDPEQKERRKMYGRAGEYRLPKWGLEYRTPSNFWLRSYQLMGFVMGLSRMALRFSNYDEYEKVGQITYNYQEGFHEEQKTRPSEEAMIWLSERLDQKQVAEAINENDFDMAHKNWLLFKEFISIFIKDNPAPKESNSWFPLWPNVLENFEYFVKKGIDHWWPEKNFMETWIKMPEGHGTNWENFIANVVGPEYQKSLKKD